MQLAPIQPTMQAVPTPAQAPGPIGAIVPNDPAGPSRAAVELARAAAQLPADDTTEVPRADAPEAVRSGFLRYARYAKILRSMPGVATSGWRSSQPDDIKVWTYGPGWSRLLETVSDLQVEGATINVTERQDDGSGSLGFWQQLQFQVNAVSAMPGVSDWVFDGAAVPGDPYTFIRFTVTDADNAAKLREFVRPELGGLPVKFVLATQ